MPGEGRRPAGPEPRQRAGKNGARWLPAYLLGLAAVSGFSMMVLEVSAPRLMAPYFGSSNYIWTNVIGVILAALAGGYYVGGKLADRWPGLAALTGVALASGLLAAVLPWACRALCPALVPEAAPETSALPVLVRGSLLATLLLFAPPLFLMGAMSPLTVRLLSRQAGVGWASGACSAAITAGAILGTFGTTLWLVPAIGSHRSVLLAAVALLLVALPGALLGGRLERRLGAGALAVAGFLALVPPGPALPGGDLVYETETPYQYARVARRDGTLLLQTEGQRRGAQAVLREGSYLSGELVWDHLVGLPWLADWRPGRPLRVLILGFGVGALSRQYRHFYDSATALEVDGVEIDPKLIEIGERFFGLDPGRTPGLEIHVADARQYAIVSSRRYDVIVLDVFSRPRQVPSHLATWEFFELVRERLEPGGLVGMNVIVPIADGEAIRGIVESVRAAFGEVWIERVPASRNVIILARRDRPVDVIGSWEYLRALDPSDPPAEFDELRLLLIHGWEHVARWPDRGPARPLTDDGTPFEHLVLEDSLVAWERSR